MPYISSICAECGQVMHVKGATICADIDNKEPIKINVWENPHTKIGEYIIEPLELIKLLQIYSQGKTTGGKNG